MKENLDSIGSYAAKLRAPEEGEIEPELEELDEIKKWEVVFLRRFEDYLASGQATEQGVMQLARDCYETAQNNKEKKERIQAVQQKVAKAQANFLKFALAASVFITSGYFTKTGKSESKERETEKIENVINTVKLSIDENGHKIYQHSDPETTKVIEAISGKRELDEDEKLTLLHYLKETLNQKYDTSFKLSVELNENGQNQYIFTEALDPGEKPKKFIYTFKTPKFDQALYESIWEISEQFNYPKIHWKIKAINSEADDLFRSTYDADKNTINLTIMSGEQEREILADIGQLEDELAHAFQFTYTKEEAEKLSSEAQTRIQNTSKTQNISIHDAQLKEYQIKDSLEHQAHQEIIKCVQANMDWIRKSHDSNYRRQKPENKAISLRKQTKYR